MAFGMYWKKASTAGALLSMVLGIAVWLWFEIEETSWPSLAPALLMSAVAMIAGSYLWPDKNPVHDQNRIETSQ
jgi:Na+/proline symporter